MQNTETPRPLSLKEKRRNQWMALGSVCVLLATCGAAWYLREGRHYLGGNPQSTTEAQNTAEYTYKNAAGSYLAGKFAAQQGQVKDALKHLSETMTYQQKDDRLLRQAYRLSVLAGDFEQAGHYSKMLGTRAEDRLLNPQLLQLVLAIKKNDYAQAAEKLKHIRSDGTNALFIPLLNGWIDLGMNKAVATAPLEENIARSGQFAPLLRYQTALLLDAAGNRKEAAQYYEAIAKEQDLSYRIAMILANFYQRSGNHKALKQIQNRYQQQYHHDLGEFSQTPLVATPREGIAEIFYGISSVLFGLEAFAEAEVPLQLALDLQPKLDAARFLMANLLEKQERYEEAVLAYTALENHPAFGLQAGIRKAYSLQDAKNNPEALQVLDILVKRYPEEADPVLAKADLLRVEKRYQEAVKVYDTALQLLKHAKEKHWPVYYARGICYERDGQWEQAEADLLEALRLEPDQPDVLNYLGYSWLIQGKHLSQAREMIEKAIARRPHDAHIIDSMGWALYQLGEYKEALDYMEQAVDLSPRDPIVNDHLGDVYWRMGYRLQAKYQWERALLFEPEEPGQADALKKKIAEGLPPLSAKKPEIASQD